MGGSDEQIPTNPLGFESSNSLSIQDIVECSRFAESKGFDAVWVADGPRGDVFPILTAIALGTQRICLGPGIVTIFPRSPWIIATASAIIDELSHGRFVLGLGLGNPSTTGNRHGLAFDRPVQRIREVVDIVRLLLRGERVDYAGEIFRIRGAAMSVPPVRSDIPIYLAAMSPHLLRLAGETADGVFLMYPTLDNVRQALTYVAEGARSVGRALAGIDTTAYVFAAVSSDGSAAVNAARRLLAVYARVPYQGEFFAQQGFQKDVELLRAAWATNDMERAVQTVTDEMVSTLSVSGTPENVVGKINELMRSELKQVVLYPCPVEGNTKKSIFDLIDVLAS